MYRWSLCTGGHCVQVVIVYRWSLHTGGLCTEMIELTHSMVQWWSLQTGPVILYEQLHHTLPYKCQCKKCQRAQFCKSISIRQGLRRNTNSCRVLLS